MKVLRFAAETSTWCNFVSREIEGLQRDPSESGITLIYPTPATPEPDSSRIQETILHGVNYDYFHLIHK